MAKDKKGKREKLKKAEEVQSDDTEEAQDNAADGTQTDNSAAQTGETEDVKPAEAEDTQHKKSKSKKTKRKAKDELTDEAEEITTAEAEDTQSQKSKSKKAKRKAEEAQTESSEAQAENAAEAQASETEEIPSKKAKRKKARKIANIKLGKKEFKVPVRRIVWSSIAVVLIVLLICGGVYAYPIFFNPRSAFGDNKPITTSTPDVTDTEETNESATPTTPNPLDKLGANADKTMYNSDIINIALIGVDHAPERDEKGQYYNDKKSYYSDCMIVLAFNFKENKVDMITCPRDTYSPIFNQKGIWKLNSSFYWGYSKNEGNWYKGFENVCRSMETLISSNEKIPPINYYIGVDMTAVKTLVDAIGGVDYNVDLEIDMQGRELHMGQQHLNGQQALDYMRARKGTDQATDAERVIRQKRMLIEIFRQMKSNNKLLELPSILQSLSGQVFTNMDFQQLCAMALFGTNLDDQKIVMRTMAGRLEYPLYNWVYSVVDAGKRNTLLQEVYGVEKGDIDQHSHYYNYNYVTLDWAKMQARGYTKIVNNILAKDATLPPEQQKMVGANLDVINQDKADLQAAVAAENVDAINNALVTLRMNVNSIYTRIGLKEPSNWYVDENPGLPNIGG